MGSSEEAAVLSGDGVVVASRIVAAQPQRRNRYVSHVELCAPCTAHVHCKAFA